MNLTISTKKYATKELAPKPASGKHRVFELTNPVLKGTKYIKDAKDKVLVFTGDVIAEIQKVKQARQDKKDAKLLASMERLGFETS